MKTTDQNIIALFTLLNQAFNDGKLSNLSITRTIGDDYLVGFEWVTRQPFELHVEFVFDDCHLCLGFDPDDACIMSSAPANPLEEWRRLVGLMDDRLASVRLFLSQVRSELPNTQAGTL